MLLPDKHIRISESVLGVAGLLLATLSQPLSLDQLMGRVSPMFGSPDWPAEHGTDSVVLGLCFLNAIGLVDVADNGEVHRCD